MKIVFHLSDFFDTYKENVSKNEIFPRGFENTCLEILNVHIITMYLTIIHIRQKYL